MNEAKTFEALEARYPGLRVETQRGMDGALWSLMVYIPKSPTTWLHLITASASHEPTRVAAVEAKLALLRAALTPVGEEAKPRPKVVCLCGSTRFMDAFHEWNWRLTLEGKIVLSVGVHKKEWDSKEEALGQDVADRLDELHKRKIDMADWVMVLDVDGYIGESTQSEFDYAVEHGKCVVLLSDVLAQERKEDKEQNTLSTPKSPYAGIRSVVQDSVMRIRLGGKDLEEGEGDE